MNRRAPLRGLESEYVFNYPVNNASFEWLATVKQSYLLRNRVQMAQRYHQDPYPVRDLAAAQERVWLHPFMQIANLSNTGYQQLQACLLPGRSFVGGLEIEPIHH